MRLFIAEKPDLGKAIAEALGGGKRDGGCIRCDNGDVITWCFGHLLSLTDPEEHDSRFKKWNMADLPMDWPISHKPIADKKEQISLIKKLASKATEIVHAGDPDDEGQLLVDELLSYIGNELPVKRVLINDYNKKIVTRALDSMRDNSEFYPLYQSALARSVADQRYGYNLTRAYTLAARASGANQVLSVGRVQTPVLGLVVRRDMANESHTAHQYHELSGVFLGAGGEFSAKYIPSETAPVDDKGRVTDKDFLGSIAAAVSGKPAAVQKADTTEKETSPPLPYNLLNLQADASRKFGFSPDTTLTATQSLREKHRLITYNRSDCEYLSDEQHDDASAVLGAIAKTANVLAKAANAGSPAIKSRAFNSDNVSAHHAIIPTENTASLENLTDEESKLYLLIARAYIAQFFPKYRYSETTIRLSVEGHEFKASCKKAIDDGWKRLYKKDKDNDEVHADEEGAQQSLEWIKLSSEIQCKDTCTESKDTKPPSKYTMATLLKDLARVAKYVTDPRVKNLLLSKDEEIKGEHGGIGTAATRSAIIKQLLNRGFIAESGKKVTSTSVGREFFDLLPESATAPDMTALWHEQQEEIKNGRLTMQQFVDGVADHVENEVNRIASEGIKVAAAVGPECPKCNQGHLSKRKSKKGVFWGCTRYPECKAIYSDNGNKPDFNKKTVQVSDDHKCPDCQKGLVRRPGKKKNAYWWGCSGFPECKFRAFDEKGAPDLKNKA